MAILEKMFKMQAEINRIKKDSKNDHFKNTYTDLNSILDELKPVFDEHKILYLSKTTSRDNRNFVILELHDLEDGSSVSSELIMQDGLNAQQSGSSLTYFRRYQLVAMLGLQTVDDDGLAGSNPIAENKEADEEQVLEMEELMKGDQKFRQDWLNFLGVPSFDKASKAQLDKAIKQLKKGK